MRIPKAVVEAMLAHATFEFPNEACGLIAADESDTIRMSYSLTNADASPVAYTIAPRDHFGALQHAERNGWELTGAFHSHPRSEALPSKTDVRLALEPDWIYIIVGPVEPGPAVVRAFRIRDGRIFEVDLEIVG